MTITSYSILNYEEIHKDVTIRSKLIADYKSIIQRRIRIQSEYLSRMKQLSNVPQMRKIPNATKATQFLFNSLINAIYAQIDNITNHVSRMEGEIIKNLNNVIVDLDNESRKQLINTGIIIKEYEKKHQDVEKLKYKMIKKGHQLRKLKEEYIVGTLVDMPFDKKNKLFIKTKEVEEVYKPLYDEFYQCAKQFNERTNLMANKLSENICKIETIQCQKVEIMKKIFMVLQISNSEYGANLIQDKASILSRINQLEAANPQFLKCPEEIQEQYKKELLMQICDPCSYINKLFTDIIDTKNIQNIVIYGHESRHRESISESMTDSQATNLRDQEPDLVQVREIAACFKNIFNETIEHDPSKSKRLEELMQNSLQNRKNFILCLQKFRALSKFDISDKKIQHIANILNFFLDSCMTSMDTYNSKFLLVLSLTYYINVGEQRIDLHNYIKNHKIWKEKQWWECALLQSSYEELKIKLSKKLQDVPITIWHIKGSGLKHSESEQELTSQNVLFNQLVFYIHNMRIFEIKEETITYLAKKYSKYFQFNPKMAANVDSELKVLELPLQDTQYDLISPNGSPNNLKKKFTRKLFF